MTSLPPSSRVFHAPRFASKVCTPDLIVAAVTAYGGCKVMGRTAAVEVARRCLEKALTEHLVNTFALLARIDGRRHRDALSGFLQACLHQREILETGKVNRPGLRKLLLLLSNPEQYPDRPAGAADAAVAQDLADLVKHVASDVVPALEAAARPGPMPAPVREEAIAALDTLEMWIGNLALDSSGARFCYEPDLVASRRRLVRVVLVGLERLTGRRPTTTYDAYADDSDAYLTPAVAALEAVFDRVAEEARQGGPAVEGLLLLERGTWPSRRTLREDVRAHLAVYPQRFKGSV